MTEVKQKEVPPKEKPNDYWGGFADEFDDIPDAQISEQSDALS
ncbi:MAG: hypothetical protein ACK559_16900 [bacterium]